MVRVKDRPSGAAPPRCGPASSGMGREGGSAGGRCKYVHVSSVAASMRLTDLAPVSGRPSRPTLPAMDSFLRTAGRSKEKSKAKADPSDIPGVCHPRMAWIYRVDQDRHLPTAAQNAFRQIAEDCRRRGGSGGGVSAAWMPRPSPREGFTASPPPDPPRHPSVAQLLTLPLRVQGAALPEPHITQQASATAVRGRPSHASSRPDAASRPPATGIAA